MANSEHLIWSTKSGGGKRKRKPNNSLFKTNKKKTLWSVTLVGNSASYDRHKPHEPSTAHDLTAWHAYGTVTTVLWQRVLTKRFKCYIWLSKQTSYTFSIVPFHPHNPNLPHTHTHTPATAAYPWPWILSCWETLLFKHEVMWLLKKAHECTLTCI